MLDRLQELAAMEESPQKLGEFSNGDVFGIDTGVLKNKGESDLDFFRRSVEMTSEKTAGDVFSEVADKPAEYGPFTSGAQFGWDMWKLYNALDAMQGESATKDQQRYFLKFVIDSNRESTWGYKAFSGFAHMPAFMIEFGTTGGVYSAMKRGGIKAVKVMLKKMLEHEATQKAGTSILKHAVKGKLKRSAATRLAKGAAETALLRVPLQAGLTELASVAASQFMEGQGGGAISGDIWRRALPNFGLVSKEDDPNELMLFVDDSMETFTEAAPRGLISGYIDWASEHTGGAIGRIPGMDKLRVLQLKFLTKIGGGNAAKGMRKVLASGGWKYIKAGGFHGVIEESGEEFAGALAKAAVPGMEEDFSDVWPGLESFTAQLAQFSVIPLAIGAHAMARGGTFNKGVDVGDKYHVDAQGRVFQVDEKGKKTQDMTGDYPPEVQAAVDAVFDSNAAVEGAARGATPMRQSREEATPGRTDEVAAGAVDKVNRRLKDISEDSEPVSLVDVPEDLSEPAKRVEDAAKAAGVDWRWFGTESGERAGVEGIQPAGGVILGDVAVLRDSDQTNKVIEGLKYHELIHNMGSKDRDTFEALVGDLAATDPEGLAAAMDAVHEASGFSIPADLRVEEGVAQRADELRGLLDYFGTEEGAAWVESFDDPADRTLIQRVVDFLRSMLKAVGIGKGSALHQQLAELSEQIGGDHNLNDIRAGYLINQASQAIVDQGFKAPSEVPTVVDRRGEEQTPEPEPELEPEPHQPDRARMDAARVRGEARRDIPHRSAARALARLNRGVEHPMVKRAADAQPKPTSAMTPAQARRERRRKFKARRREVGDEQARAEIDAEKARIAQLAVDQEARANPDRSRRDAPETKAEEAARRYDEGDERFKPAAEPSITSFGDAVGKEYHETFIAFAMRDGVPTHLGELKVAHHEDGSASVLSVEVEKAERRKGYARSLYAKFRSQYPEVALGTLGEQTPAGAALRRALYADGTIPKDEGDERFKPAGSGRGVAARRRADNIVGAFRWQPGWRSLLAWTLPPESGDAVAGRLVRKYFLEMLRSGDAGYMATDDGGTGKSGPLDAESLGSMGLGGLIKDSEFASDLLDVPGWDDLARSGEATDAQREQLREFDRSVDWSHAGRSVLNTVRMETPPRLHKLDWEKGENGAYYGTEPEGYSRVFPNHLVGRYRIKLTEKGWQLRGSGSNSIHGTLSDAKDAAHRHRLRIIADAFGVDADFSGVDALRKPLPDASSMRHGSDGTEGNERFKPAKADQLGFYSQAETAARASDHERRVALAKRLRSRLDGAYSAGDPQAVIDVLETRLDLIEGEDYDPLMDQEAEGDHPLAPSLEEMLSQSAMAARRDGLTASELGAKIKTDGDIAVFSQRDVQPGVSDSDLGLLALEILDAHERFKKIRKRSGERFKPKVSQHLANLRKRRLAESAAGTTPEKSTESKRPPTVATERSTEKSTESTESTEPEYREFMSDTVAGATLDRLHALLKSDAKIEGRPDLAKTAASPQGQRTQDAIDELRNFDGIPKARHLLAAQAAGKARVEADPEGMHKLLLHKIATGQVLNAEETFALRDLANRFSQLALRTNDREAWKEAARLSWAYRESGSAVSEAFRARQMRYNESVRAEELVTLILARPTLRASAKLRRLAKEREKLQRETRAQKRAPTKASAERFSPAPSADPKPKRKKKKTDLEKVNDQIEAILDEEAANSEKVRAALERNGYDPDNITEEMWADPYEATKLIRIIAPARATAGDRARELLYASMLSHPMTQMRNLGGNVINLGLSKFVQDVVESAVNVAVKDPNAPSFADTKVLFTHWGAAMSEAGRRFIRAYKVEPLAEGFDAGMAGKLSEGIQTPAFARDTRLGKAYQWLLKSYSLDMLRAVDEAFKGFAETLTIRQLAVRMARADGLTDSAEIDARADEIMQNPIVHDRAALEALELFFQDKLAPDSLLGVAEGATKKARTALDKAIPFFGTLNLPFIATSVRIFKQTARRSPGVNHGMILAKYLVRAIQGEKTLTREKITDAADAIISSMILFGTLSLIGGEDDDDLPIIGGTRADWQDKTATGLQRSVNPAYTLRVGDTLLNFKGRDPVSGAIAISVDMARGIRDAGAGAGVRDAFLAMGRNLRDQSYMQAMGDLDQLVSGRKNVGGYLFNTTITPWVPNILRGAARDTDENIRERAAWNRTKGNAAMLQRGAYRLTNSQRLAPPPKYDVWGRPVKRTPVGIMNGIILERNISSGSATKGDVLLYHWARRVKSGDLGPDAKPWYPQLPATYYTHKGKRIDWTPEEYQMLTQLTGEEFLMRVERREWPHITNPSGADLDKIKSYLATSKRHAKRRVRAMK